MASDDDTSETAAYGVEQWAESQEWIRRARLCLSSAQRLLEAAVCHERAAGGARRRAVRRLQQASTRVEKSMGSVALVLGYTRDSALAFKAIATIKLGGDCAPDGLSDDPLSERVLLDEQALLINSLFVWRRAQTFEHHVEAFISAPAGSNFAELLEAAAHSLTELHISAMVSSEMVRAINLAFEAWMKQYRIAELALAGATSERFVN